MRLSAVFAGFMALLPCSALSQTNSSTDARFSAGAEPCFRQVHLSFHAVSASARYGLIFDQRGTGEAAILASWTADGRLHRTNVQPVGGPIVPLGAGFPVGEQVVGLSIADCQRDRPLPRLIRLDRSSPDHGYRRTCPALDPGAGRPILCLSAGRMPSWNEGERPWQ